MNCCTDCDFKSQISTNVINHIESKHVTSMGYTCPLCSKFCSSKNAWHLHKSRYHKGNWLQGLRNCCVPKCIRTWTEWTAVLTVISSLKLQPMYETMLRPTMSVLAGSTTHVTFVEEPSSPKILFKVTSQGPKEDVVFNIAVNFLNRYDSSWCCMFILLINCKVKPHNRTNFRIWRFRGSSEL